MNETSSSLVTFLPFVVTLAVATGGWLFAYLHSRHQARTQAELDLVNRKLRNLYGPLYARLLAGEAAWSAFRRTKWPEHGQNSYFARGHRLSERELETWRHWMTTVFHPMNKKIEAIIVENLDFLEEDEMPAAFTDALAHIQVYDAVLKSWEAGDFSEHRSIVNFPGRALMAIVEPTYRRLREEQARFSGGTASRHA